MVRVEVITPERIAYEGEGILVTVPTTDGLLGIGAGHVPLLASLKAGEVIVRRPGGEDEFLAVAGGFVEILPTVVRVLADSAEHAHELNEAVIKEAIAAAEHAKKEAVNQIQFAEASVLIENNLVRLRVAQRKHSHGGHSNISSQEL